MTTLDMAQMYREHWDTIAAYLRRRGCDRHLAEDLTQETFLRALRNADRYADQGKPLAWLHTIAKRLLLDHRKNAAVRLTGWWDLRDSDVPLFGKAPDDPSEFLTGVAGRAQVVTAVRDALADLNPAQQRVIDLRFRRELSVLETADAVGANEGAVKATQARACRRLATDERLVALRPQVATV